MEQIEITIIKEGKDILITSTEGRQIKITQNNNESMKYNYKYKLVFFANGSVKRAIENNR